MNAALYPLLLLGILFLLELLIELSDLVLLVVFDEGIALFEQLLVELARERVKSRIPELALVVLGDGAIVDKSGRSLLRTHFHRPDHHQC